MFENKSIRHIQMVICHMWRVANGLDNAVLDDSFCHKPESSLVFRTQIVVTRSKERKKEL